MPVYRQAWISTLRPFAVTEAQRACLQAVAHGPQVWPGGHYLPSWVDVVADASQEAGFRLVRNTHHPGF
eukprot:1048202-Lingulodinium_polyedra.AAC.1